MGHAGGGLFSRKVGEIAHDADQDGEQNGQEQPNTVEHNPTDGQAALRGRLFKGKGAQDDADD